MDLAEIVDVLVGCKSAEHDECVANIMQTFGELGFIGTKEVPAPLPMCRTGMGRIDILLSHPDGISVAVELDFCNPRMKSCVKLRNTVATYRIIVLRGMPKDRRKWSPEGIDALVKLKSNSTGRCVWWPKKTHKTVDDLDISPDALPTWDDLK